MWKQHPIYTRYELNEKGQIRNAKTQKTLSGNNTVNHKGYVRVTLHTETGQVTKNLHRLVMETFDTINNEMEVNHIDGNKFNNSFRNLEWVTRKENAEHAKVHRLYKSCEDVHTAILTNDIAVKICKSLSAGNSIVQTMDLLGIPKTDNNFSNISKIKNRKTWVNISSDYTWTDDIKYKTYPKDMLMSIIEDILDGVKLKNIASKFPNFDQKKLYNMIKKVSSGHLYKGLYNQVTEERSTTIEIEFISRVE